jgi:hypothetical protein
MIINYWKPICISYFCQRDFSRPVSRKGNRPSQIGSLAAIKAANALKRWVTAADEKTCQVCAGNEVIGPNSRRRHLPRWQPDDSITPKL